MAAVDATSLGFAAAPSNVPEEVTILLTNVPYSDQVWIVLPQAGNLWVGYEYQDEPAQQLYLWHQGGTTTQVPPGFNVFAVGAGDALAYQLAYPGQAIKLGWGYE